MKRLFLWLALMGIAGATAGPNADLHQKRMALGVLEKTFDGRLERSGGDDPFLLLGTTRGVYLHGYGAVLTAEVNLVNSANVSPFRPTIPPEYRARLHTRKLERLPLLKQTMRDMLEASAAALDSVPANEQIVIGVSLFYYSWEDTTGLPSQVLMQANRQQLLEHKGSDDFIQTQEY